MWDEGNLGLEPGRVVALGHRAWGSREQEPRVEREQRRTFGAEAAS